MRRRRRERHPGFVLRRRVSVKVLVAGIVMFAVLSIVMIPALKELKATMDEQKSYEY